MKKYKIDHETFNLGLKPNELKIFIVLSNIADEQNRVYNADIEISKLIGLSRQQMNPYKRRLIGKGLIIKHGLCNYEIAQLDGQEFLSVDATLFSPKRDITPSELSTYLFLLLILQATSVAPSMTNIASFQGRTKVTTVAQMRSLISKGYIKPTKLPRGTHSYEYEILDVPPIED